MTEEKLEELWKVLSSATNINNVEYGTAVTIGSVFGEMKTIILEQQKQIETLKTGFNSLGNVTDGFIEDAEKVVDFLNTSISEINYALKSHKSKEVKEFYLGNAIRFINMAKKKLDV